MRNQKMGLLLLLLQFTLDSLMGARTLVGLEQDQIENTNKPPWRIHTLFSVECRSYFDWQTVGLMHSFRKSGQPGPITRLMSCTDEEFKGYRGMDLAPTMKVPSMSSHPRTGDWYPAINKPAGVLHWLTHSEDVKNVDWVVILDADMIIRGLILPWELGAEKGKPVAAYYGYLVGCDNILAGLHTKHPELCDKVGGLLVMHIDDLQALAPLWLSKTEEVRGDRAHWGTNITGDIYSQGWISEMYGYSFGAAEVGLRHKISDDLMIYPGYIPRKGVVPILLHYGLPFSVGNWSFSKFDHHEDDVVYDCGRLFPAPPYPREVRMIEADPNKRRGLFLSIECIDTLNEGLLIQHAASGCPKPKWSKYLSFLKSKTFYELTKPKLLISNGNSSKKAEMQQNLEEPGRKYPKIHTIFSTECSDYFDWQTVGLVHSFHLSDQPGNITRLLSCTNEDLQRYAGHDLAPTHYVPSMSRHPLTGDWYPAINKPAAVVHWLNHVKTDAEFIVILDADMILRGPITPWEFNAERGYPVSTPYEYLIGCDNELAKIHTRHPEACDKVGGVIIMHIDDLRKFAMLWLHKTEEVRADKAYYAPNFTGDIYGSGWISEMYGYSFGAAELNLRHRVNSDMLLYPGYIPRPGIEPQVFHYELEFGVGNWRFDKANWRNTDLINNCWAKFPDPPDPNTLTSTDANTLRRDKLSIQCMRTLNDALYLHHKRRHCPDPDTNDNSDRGNIQRNNASFHKIESLAKETNWQTLNLRHRVNSDMLLYPGYIPRPGIEPRVFHYGLEFGVGNWRFDKANWRNTDLINNCWAKFPDPPDPNTLTSTDANTLRRDKLSIQCMRTLNDALYLHHKRRHCPDPDTNDNSDRGNIQRNNASVHKIESLAKETNWQTVPFPDAADSNFKLFLVHRYWITGLWCVSVLGFLTVVSFAFSGRNFDGTRCKAYRYNRIMNSRISDSNGNLHQTHE